MKTTNNFYLSLSVMVAMSAAMVLPQTVQAGGTPADGTFAGNLVHNIQAPGVGTPIGDYINDANGLNSFHEFFIEVPPSSGTLTVELFDADYAGGGAAAETAAGLDQVIGGGGAISTTYTLFNPTGGSVATLTPGTTGHNIWTTLGTVNSPAAGHWRVTVNATGGNDVNAFGIRATGFNMYYQLGVPGQESNTNRTRVFTQHPYITQGCNFTFNEFDADSNSTTAGDLDFDSRSGTFTQNFSDAALSPNDTWTGHTVTGWTADDRATEYGIWDYVFDIQSANSGASANYITMWAGQEGASPAPTPSANPPTDSLRIYLPDDGGGAPAKPYMAQWLEHVSGPNPPTTLGGVTRVRVLVQIINPTSHAITFSSPTNVVTANVPDEGLDNGRTVFRGVESVSQGSTSGIASGALDGDVVWNPGTVSGNTTATLRYLVDVDPDILSPRVEVTGNGTTGTYLDETGNAAQGRATYTHGPLCELAVEASEILFIELDYFRASSQGLGQPVLLEWSTATEIDNAGFSVYRAIPDGFGSFSQGERLNSVLIPSNSGGSSGGDYTLIDPLTISSDLESRAYYLEDIDFSGKSTLHGPFEMSSRAATLGIEDWTIYE